MLELQDQMRTPHGVAPFFNHLPVHIQFGEGAADGLARPLSGCGARTALIVIDDGLESDNARVARSLAAVEQTGIHLVRHTKAPGEPTTTTLDEAAAALARSGASAIIALGGGSVIDTAKAARLCVQHGCTFAEFLGSDRQYPAPDVALIAVPTTAGTGSEVSGGAVVTDSISGRKSGIASPNLRPQYAIVDPLLTHSVPPTLTAYTGIDALAQAIAGMIARVRTPIGDAIALEAVRLIGRSLVPAYRDGDDHEARSEMACGSLMAGLTMNISDCAAEHSLAQAIGSIIPAAHGLTVGIVLAQTLERERRHVPDRLERVADALGIADDGSRDGSRAVRGVRDLLGQLEFPVLASLGIDATRLDELTELAMQDFFITQSPVPWTADEVRAAFQSALGEEPRGAGFLA